MKRNFLHFSDSNHTWLALHQHFSSEWTRLFLSLLIPSSVAKLVDFQHKLLAFLYYFEACKSPTISKVHQVFFLSFRRGRQSVADKWQRTDSCLLGHLCSKLSWKSLWTKTNVWHEKWLVNGVIVSHCLERRTAIHGERLHCFDFRRPHSSMDHQGHRKVLANLKELFL